MIACNKSPAIRYLSAKMNDDCAKVPRCFGAFVKTATQFVISWQQKSMFDEEEASQKEEASGS